MLEKAAERAKVGERTLDRFEAIEVAGVEGVEGAVELEVEAAEEEVTGESRPGVGVAAVAGVGGGARAASRAARRNSFVVFWRRASCSSGTVSRFLSMKPSTSYSTSMA